MPAALFIFVGQAYFLAAMDPWTPLAAALLAGAANLAGDVALVCGLGYGIAGAAVATAGAQVQQEQEPCSRLPGSLESEAVPDGSICAQSCIPTWSACKRLTALEPYMGRGCCKWLTLQFVR